MCLRPVAQAKIRTRSAEQVKRGVRGGSTSMSIGT